MAVRVKSVRVFCGVMIALGMMLHLLVRLDKEVEDDIARYMKQSSILRSPQEEQESLSSSWRARRPSHESNPTQNNNKINNNIQRTELIEGATKRLSYPHPSYPRFQNVTTMTKTKEMGPPSNIGLNNTNENTPPRQKEVVFQNISQANITSTTTAKTKNQKKKKTKRDDDTVSRTGSYWNLSCPLELSMFSGAHMGGDYLERAQKARDMVRNETLGLSEMINWNVLRNRRVYFIGDSLLRQVFISFACLSWHHVESYTVPWYDQRPVRSRQPHTIGSGEHSKFEEARVRLQGNIELVFYHGIGNLLELGEEYQSYDPHSWISSCFLKKPFTTVSPTLPTDVNDDKSQTKKDIPMKNSMTTLNVTRQDLVLRSRDIVLLNGSVHGSRTMNLQTILNFLKCKDMMKYPPRHWPIFGYVRTGGIHFPTAAGTFEEQLLETDDDFGCRNSSDFRGYQMDEMSLLQNYIPMIGAKVVDLQYQSGDLHVGGRDCLHWLQPGIPDLLAFQVSQFIVGATATALATGAAPKS